MRSSRRVVPRHPSARVASAGTSGIGMTAAAEVAREMALAELLGEVDRGANVSAGGTGTSVGHQNGHSSLDLNFAYLDITTGAGDADEAAFARLLGVGVDDDTGSLDVELVKYADHDVVKNVMEAKGHSDLNQKAKAVTSRLKAVELESIQEYVAESKNLHELHAQINGCDEVLGSMETLLSQFKDDLGKIGGEIKDLQNQSINMSVKLSNRKLANGILGDFVSQITVPPELIHRIVEDDVSEQYMQHLVRLDKRLRFIRNDVNASNSLAGKEIAPELNRLRAKAALKARDFLLTKLYLLRKPKTNVQILQQNVLLKYKYLVHFLKQHAGEILVEVKHVYVETMSSLLKQAVAGHVRSLSELQMSSSTQKNETLVSYEGYDLGPAVGRKGNPSPSGAIDAGYTLPSSPFALGTRVEVLDALETSPPVVVHMAHSSGTKLQHEKLFRSAHKLLMDTCTFEFLFLNEFFAVGDEADTAHTCLDIFSGALKVMDEQGGLGGSNTSQSVAHDLIRQGSHNVVGLVLMLRINAEHQLIMRRRGVPVLDRHLHGVELALWPKLKRAFDVHVVSATRAANDPAKVTRLWSNDTNAHPVVVRFADLVVAMLSATGDALVQFGQIEKDIERLRDAVTNLVNCLAEKFADKKRGAEFTANCADAVCSILSEARVIGPLDGSLAAVGGDSLAGSPTHKFFEQLRDKAKSEA